MDKTCTICKRLFPIEEFNKKNTNKDGRQNVCRECNSRRCRRYYAENREKHRRVIKEQKQRHLAHNREWLDQIKLRGCVLCSENDPCCIDFHHLGGDKDMMVSELLYRSSSEAKIRNEVRKCACVCSNCHRKIHAGKVSVGEEHRCRI